MTVSRPGPSRTKEKGSDDLNPEGFFEVHVQYGKCVDLAYSLGLKPGDVLQTVEEDNLARKAEYTRKAQRVPTSDFEGGSHGPEEVSPHDEQAQVRFDYTDTDDDLGSEED